MLDTGRSGVSELDVEQMAVARLEQENTEQAPANAEQLIESTEHAVDTLASRLAKNAEAHDLLTMLSEQVLFYLENEEGEPTPFALLLFKPEEELSVDEIASQARVKKMIVSELNPLLYQIRYSIELYNAMTQAGDSAAEQLDFGEGEALVAHLSTGKAESQTTTTLFGFLEGLSAHQENTPRQVVLVNPRSRSQKNTEYWKEQMAAKREATEEKHTDYAELLADRSARSV
jgi:hypothetical protein